eukprot:1180342-Prorocentrum_minimum.AAC.1
MTILSDSETDRAVDEGTAPAVGLKRTREGEQEVYKRGINLLEKDMKDKRNFSFNSFALIYGQRGEKWEKVGKWTQGERRGRGVMGVERILAVIGTGGPSATSAVKGIMQEPQANSPSSNTVRPPTEWTCGPIRRRKRRYILTADQSDALVPTQFQETIFQATVVTSFCSARVNQSVHKCGGLSHFYFVFFHSLLQRQDDKAEISG